MKIVVGISIYIVADLEARGAHSMTVEFVTNGIMYCVKQSKFRLGSLWVNDAHSWSPSCWASSNHVTFTGLSGTNRLLGFSSDSCTVHSSTSRLSIPVSFHSYDNSYLWSIKSDLSSHSRRLSCIRLTECGSKRVNNDAYSLDENVCGKGSRFPWLSV